MYTCLGKTAWYTRPCIVCSFSKIICCAISLIVILKNVKGETAENLAFAEF